MADADGLPEQVPPVMHARGYQMEMLEESLRTNIIIALDTGSGKTHIAVLRMKLEAEHQSRKISWFLAPTVALVEQQREVIATAIPVSVGFISGSSEPNQWRDPILWRKILDTHRIMVSTPQVLLDALSHSFIHLGRDIGLLVFDEAHHAIGGHPYNSIMKFHYFQLPERTSENSQGAVRPAILGLTASPIYGGNVDKSFRDLEQNMDCIIRSSRVNRDELANYVHKPVFKHILYRPPDYLWEDMPSPNFVALQTVVAMMNIENDPYVQSLRKQLQTLRIGDQRKRVDQRLSRAVHKQDTFTHKGLRDFARAAGEIGMDLGPWAADWYVWKVIEQARLAANPYNNIMMSWEDKEKRYLMDALNRVNAASVSFDPDVIRAGMTPKARALVECLKQEAKSFEAQDETYSGLVFVTRRDTVIALAEVLSNLPDVKELFSIGCLLGSSNSVMRHTFLDITRSIVKNSQADTLRDFKIGDKNLIVSTAVAEEGLDIQACGSVIRFDPPPNVVAWAQSRGRARRKRSSFILMFEDNGVHEKLVTQWEDTERRMMALYNDPARDELLKNAERNQPDDDYIVYRIESTGALLTLHSATTHLYHFCSTLPSAGHGAHVPIFDLDPPDYPEGWSSQEGYAVPRVPYGGPWGATCVLPRIISSHLREFQVECIYPTKMAARRHAALQAYLGLYRAGLIDDNLLPLSSTIEADQTEEVKFLLKEVEKRAGMASVSIQMNPWENKVPDADVWYTSELKIEGLPALRMFTRNPLPTFVEQDLPNLYVPGYSPLKVRLRSVYEVKTSDECIDAAKRYTHQMFSILYSSRMDPENTDFSYMFLPVNEGVHEGAWKKRRRWMEGRSTLGQLENPERANAEILGKQFSFPDDLALLRSVDKYDKAVRFVRWRHEPVTPEEEEALVERYESFPDMKISYPVIVARPFPRRVNFLIPLSSETEGLSDEELILLPQFTIVNLVSKDDVEFSSLLPSVIRWLSNALTVFDLRENLLSSSPVSDVAFDLLSTAITAPASQEAINYQRLETLGDTVIKFIVGLQLYAEHPHWHEGYLSRRKDHAVSNVRLAKEAVARHLYKWIIRDRFVPRKWKPRYVGETDTRTKKEIRKAKEAKEALEGATDAKKQKQKRGEQLSTKMLADVVEALIGASYEHGGFDLAVDCAKIFTLGLTWDKLPARVDTILGRVEEHEGLPSQLELVERMLNYRFSRKILLVEALTHASYHSTELETVSYERMEFLGDSALDMVITDYLYHVPGKNYGPGHMHLRKEALVNAQFLAFICLSTSIPLDATMPTWNSQEGVTLSTDKQQVHLWQCLLHSSARVLEDQSVTFARYEKNKKAIRHALEHETIYPWAALTSLQAPKFISDMVESLLGAVYLDSVGNLKAVRGVIEHLGMMAILERITRDEVDVLHPVSRLAEWASKQNPKIAVKYKIEKKEGNVSCTVFLDEDEGITVTEVYRSRASQDEVRFAAAEKTIKMLQVPEEYQEDEGEGEWGEIPEHKW